MRPKKMVTKVNSDEYESYVASDYATPGACGVLAREGQLGAAQAVLEEHGHFMGDISTMDPMEMLILLEEYGNGE